MVKKKKRTPVKNSQITKIRKRQPLSKELVLDTAINLADEFGLEKLSMRSLALRLGVEAMSLYNYVKDKNDLLDGMVDTVISQITLPKIGGNWKKEMKKRARSARKILNLHPWSPMLIVSRINVGPAMLSYFDASLGCLHCAGYSLPSADHIINAIDSHIYGYILQELNFPIDSKKYAQTAKEFMPSLEESPYTYLTRLTKEVVTKKYNGLHNFEFGLDLILDGIAFLSKPSHKTNF
ncbi:TetR/AcrR family transcriptional regulator C-terminal domain-containing protein [Leptospira harrisiae]|uniref:AcrR family transcriptional regulator n=1 Tax=Leptospira harrisiae TaxID=2023189 RepID=A0A2N0AIW6_9LEPT|nr:TetR/AcrR family transcriptional regulator C-terminal domain-containing protein [Leptospira harrisiae]PJZ84219.1 AcrR family transcriptional regulator [Leptospira harrisiae]PKA07866.1 AcrR family transcriptional regulator [Leptospira harrisiae]